MTCHGSSPHTRGLPRIIDHYYMRERIIPAHAGFTSAWPATSLTRTDHPRTRGVYNYSSSGGKFDDGSSPHTRGLRFCRCRRGLSLRIIPAHAGFTRSTSPARGARPDHPRTRGVYRVSGARPSWRLGSSPHTRGLRPPAVPPPPPVRIIPAHAGFTCRTARPGRTGRDHPRTRGVYWAVSSRPGQADGSSPHTRGLPRNIGRCSKRPRIIPAHAGFTL